MAFLYRQLSGLNPLIGDTGTGEIGVSPDALGDYNIPTLMVAGAQDRIFPLAILKEVSQVIPGAQLHIVAEAGHSPYFETAEEFNKVVGAFIGEHVG